MTATSWMAVSPADQAPLSIRCALRRYRLRPAPVTGLVRFGFLLPRSEASDVGGFSPSPPQHPRLPEAGGRFRLIVPDLEQSVKGYLSEGRSWGRLEIRGLHPPRTQVAAKRPGWPVATVYRQFSSSLDVGLQGPFSGADGCRLHRSPTLRLRRRQEPRLPGGLVRRPFRLFGRRRVRRGPASMTPDQKGHSRAP
jgi:hypothetical protein